MKTINNSEGQGSLPFWNAHSISDHFTITLDLNEELDMERKDGMIYIAINLINGKSYVGQTIRLLEKRIMEHKKWYSCPLIHSAIKKYGIENFKWISFSCPEEDLDWQERFLIKELNTLAPNGYNLDSGGNKNKSPHKITKEKMRKKARKRWANLKNKKEQSTRTKKYFEKHPERKEKEKEIKKKYYEEHPEKRFECSNRAKKYHQDHPEVGTQQTERLIKMYEEHPEKIKEWSKKMEKWRKEHTGKNHPNARAIILVSPTGKKYNMIGYYPFCRKNGLAPSSIQRVLNGKQKYYKGWTGRYLEEKKDKNEKATVSI